MNNLQSFSNPILLTTNMGRKNNQLIDENLPYKVIRCKSVRITKNEYLSIVDRKTKRKLEELCKNKIDIIHTQTKYALSSFALKLGKKYNIPVVTTSHTNYLTQYKSQLKLPFIYKIFLNHVKHNINKHHGVTTPSNYMKNLLLEMGINAPIEVIPNGDDLSRYRNNLIEKDYQSNNFLYVGRLTKEKNINLILQSLKIIKENKINFKMTFVGGGKIAYYKKKVKELNIDAFCNFIGPISDRKELASIYQNSLINLIPSYGESFGLTLRESASLQTPSIVIKNSAPAEDIKHNVNGFVSQNDPISFSNAIISAINDRAKLQQISVNCSELSNNWNKITKLYLDYYNKIINENRPQTI